MRKLVHRMRNVPAACTAPPSGAARAAGRRPDAAAFCELDSDAAMSCSPTSVRVQTER